MKKMSTNTPKHTKRNVLGLHALVRRSERGKLDLTKKSRKRNIEDELLDDHQVDKKMNTPQRYSEEESHVHRNDLSSVQHKRDSSSHLNDGNRKDVDEIDIASNTIILDPKPAPTLDSPSTRTRLALRRQLASNCETPKPIENNETNGQPSENIPKPKRKRGQTKMKTIAIDQDSRVNIQYNKLGQPIGESSIGLSSFLGPLVREVVPVNLDDWRKLPTKMKVVLWRSIQSRYNVNEDWEKHYFFKKMGNLWRAGKSRLVKEIRNASTDNELLQLKPDNMSSEDDWNDFINVKMSASFMVKSEKFKAMKKKQLPHTSSRQGFARMAEEMKQSGSDPSSVTRVMVWSKAHKSKDGEPVNLHVAEKLARIEEIEKEAKSTAYNVDEDALSKVFGPDRGQVRGLGFGVTRSKLSIISQQDNKYTTLEKKMFEDGRRTK